MPVTPPAHPQLLSPQATTGGRPSSSVPFFHPYTCNVQLILTPQTNVKGPMLAAKAFLATANKSHATILGVTTGTSGLPPAMLPGLSAYISSKLAQVKMLEFLAAENPNIFVASMHPGMVETDIFTKSGARADQLPMDTGLLTPSFTA